MSDSTAEATTDPTAGAGLGGRLWDVVRVFLKLGLASFGGPAAHMATMEYELVERRRWLSHQRFLDLMGISHLIPGPNAVELANQIGYQRAGLLGCLLAGLAFTLPGAAISLGMAWGYLRYASIPDVQAYLSGIKPVVVALMAAAIVRLGRKTLRDPRLVIIAAAVVAPPLWGADGVLTLLVASLAGAVFLHLTRRRDGKPTRAALLLGAAGAASPASAAAVLPSAAVVAVAGALAPGAAAPAVSLVTLVLFFLKVGAFLYGGGFVLVAYLQNGLVDELGWVTQQQLLDAIAVGQITPGPLLSTVTFVGYLAAGTPGAVLGTLAVITPAVVIVAAAYPLIPRLRSWHATALFLDAVTAGSIGLTLAALVELAPSAVGDGRGAVVALVAAAAAIGTRISPIWLVAGGALAGRLLLG